VSYAAAALALALYAQGFARLRRRRRSLAPAWAAVAFVAGVLVALAALAPPFDRLSDRSLTAHMSQHLLLGDFAPLLLAAALAGPRALFAVPRRLLRLVARLTWLRALARPSVALALWLVAVYSWHLPALYDAALRHPALHAGEHASFLTAGLLVWTQIFNHGRSAGKRSAFAGLVLLAGMPLTEILVASGPLYTHYPHDADQLHAALAMMAEQVATLGTASLLLLHAHVLRVGELLRVDAA
jgi:putative membrane protein